MNRNSTFNKYTQNERPYRDPSGIDWGFYAICLIAGTLLLVGVYATNSLI